jgi:ketosteroid isomerase-like protein
VTHVLHLRDGKVTEFWDAYVDQYASDEFWA